MKRGLRAPFVSAAAMLYRLFKYALIVILLLSTVGISVFSAWKVGYLTLPAQVQHAFTSMEDQVKRHRGLAVVQEQLNKSVLGGLKIYRWRDEKGNMVIADTPPPKGIVAEVIEQ